MAQELKPHWECGPLLAADKLQSAPDTTFTMAQCRKHSNRLLGERTILFPWFLGHHHNWWAALLKILIKIQLQYKNIDNDHTSKHPSFYYYKTQLQHLIIMATHYTLARSSGTPSLQWDLQMVCLLIRLESLQIGYSFNYQSIFCVLPGQ